MTIKFYKSLLRILLLLTVSCLPTQGQDENLRDFPKEIDFLIDKNPAWGYNENGIEQGDRISIRCIFQNNGKKAVSLLIANHDDYHVTLAFPLLCRLV